MRLRRHPTHYPRSMRRPTIALTLIKAFPTGRGGAKLAPAGWGHFTVKMF
jgi:hypothetical protein